jgi:hypothetical protein
MTEVPTLKTAVAWHKTAVTKWALMILIGILTLIRLGVETIPTLIGALIGAALLICVVRLAARFFIGKKDTPSNNFAWSIAAVVYLSLFCMSWFVQGVESASEGSQQVAPLSVLPGEKQDGLIPSQQISHPEYAVNPGSFVVDSEGELKGRIDQNVWVEKVADDGTLTVSFVAPVGETRVLSLRAIPIYEYLTYTNFGPSLTDGESTCMAAERVRVLKEILANKYLALQYSSFGTPGDPSLASLYIPSAL